MSHQEQNKGIIYIIREIVKRAAFKTGVFTTRYEYLITPGQILALLSALKAGETIEGDVIEVGVARGKTTVLLNRFLDELNSEKTYYVVDTFGGFTEDDVEYEKSHRGKSIYSFVGFSYNDRKVWEKVVLKKNRIERVRVIQNDIKKVDFPDHVRFSTAFIDVDLYLPTLNALRRIYPLTSAGGRIVVDDIWVHESGAYDGARQAFQEFVSENNITDFEIIPPRCGIIYK